MEAGLDPETTDEVLLGLEHAFLPQFVVGANLTWRRTVDVGDNQRELILDPVTGEVRPVTAADYVEGQVLAGALPNGDPYEVQTYTLACPGCRTGGRLLENTDRAVDYRGVTLHFVKRLSDRWMARGYFTAGEAEWDIGPGYAFASDPNPAALGTDVDGGLYAGRRTTRFTNSSPLQSSWFANLNGLYQVAPERPWGFNVSANLYAREGYPTPYARPADGNTKEVRVTDRIDAFRTPDVFTVDLRLEKEFGLTGDAGLAFAVEVFNLFDESYPLIRNAVLGTGRADFLEKTLSPRVWRLGVRMSWR